MLAAVRRGDTVVTGGGFIGKVTKVIDDNELEIDLGGGTKVTALRSTLADVRVKGDARVDVSFGRRATGGDREAVFTFAFFAISIAENLIENVLGRSTDFLFMLFLLLMLAGNAIRRPASEPAPAHTRDLPIPPSAYPEPSHG